MIQRNLNLLLTCLFLVCIILTIYEIKFCTLKDSVLAKRLPKFIYFNSFITVLVSLNVFAYFLKHRLWYYGGKLGFGSFVMGYFAVIWYFIFTLLGRRRTYRSDSSIVTIIFYFEIREYQILFLQTFPMLLMGIFGFFLTQNVIKESKIKNNTIENLVGKDAIMLLPINVDQEISSKKAVKKLTFEHSKLTFAYNFCVSIFLFIEVGWILYCEELIGYALILAASVDIISAFLILFSIVAVLTKKWIFYMHGIIGYTIFILRNLVFCSIVFMVVFNRGHLTSSMHWDTKNYAFYHDSDDFALFTVVVIHFVIGIFGLILTISSFLNLLGAAITFSKS